jgi:hypothetical protein
MEQPTGEDGFGDRSLDALGSWQEFPSLPEPVVLVGPLALVSQVLQ